jgi:excinuclease ABC subunit A
MCPICLGLGYENDEDVKVCSSCKGSRLKSYPSAARLGDKKIQEVTDMTIRDSLTFFEQLKLLDHETLIAEELIKEIKQRLKFIIDVGLHYLSLNRTAPSLSGGEAQRVRLASQIGSGLVGVTYILDEPSIGLHPRDNLKLISTLKRLRDKGNTVIVVEHDEETILEADEVVDFGPGPGVLGGEIIFQGSVEKLMECPNSITGQYLSGKKLIPLPKKRRKPQQAFIEIISASHNNLKNINVKIPLGLFVAVTGVSGSGKSSLVFDILYPWLDNEFHRANLKVGKCQKILGSENLDKVICIDQKPIGRTPRSNPATYIKLFDDIRNLFSELPESKAKGFLPGRFSFNVKEGSCSSCNGMGMIKVDMDFMEDCWILCNLCEGKRFDPETLSVTFKGKSIHDILDLSIAEALVFFEAIPTIRKKLEVLNKVGLSYMKVGQPSPTLSGGEAQRIKLAKELVRPSTGKTLYLFDEPTTGLHFSDTHNLLNVMQELVDRGNTIIVIEHNMEVVKVADWIIDLGPEGGSEGGRLIASNTPEIIAKMDTPTGKELKIFIERNFKISKYKKVDTHAFSDFIEVECAKEHNLKGVSVKIPREQITICTGPSGSGKSSLAFDTIYAEGQRRYTESLSPYARQFVQQMPKPKVESIEGLSPSIAIEQKAAAGNPRSTVGTLTEVYDFLRILFARLGVAYCPESGLEIQTISKEFVVEKILKEKEETGIWILSPLELNKNESFEDFQQRLLKKGFVRIYLNETFYDLDSYIPYERGKKNKLYLVIDRLKITKDAKSRLFEAVELAASISKGILAVIYDFKDKKIEQFFNLSFAVAKTGKSYPPLTPKSFAFNLEEGMCLSCQGLGTQWGADLAKIEELSSLTLKSLLRYLLYSLPVHIFNTFFLEENIDIDSKIEDLTDREKQLIMNGSQQIYHTKEGFSFKWVGINHLLAIVGLKGKHPAKYISRRWLNEITCSSCMGSRLNPLSSLVKLNGLTMKQVTQMPVLESIQFLEKLKIPKNLQSILSEVLSQSISRLKFLDEIGLNYISLNRTAPTLSDGEAQRIRLARQLGSGLTGVLYVLDEPTVGLHPCEVDRLKMAIKKLKNLGNTLLIVEHDPQILNIADYCIDMGPKAGKAGGFIVSKGTLKEIKKDPNSLTGAYLSGLKQIKNTKEKRGESKNFLVLKNAVKHNLKKVCLNFQIGRFTCITGPSGSGKSTLLHDVLKPLLQMSLLRSNEAKTEFGMIEGADYFEKLIVIDQDPIGQTLRSDVATYVELLTPIREFLAKLPNAQALGLLPRHFSYNIKAGMCMSCYGIGHKKIEMQFLPPVSIICPECMGARLNKKSLQVNCMGKNFGDILKMTVDEAIVFFENHPKMIRILSTLQSVGLGYVSLGQEVQTLSGGEAQRLKLSFELAKRSQGKTLYLIDEPTTGLHSEDLIKLLAVMQRLVDLGNTMIVIEHNLDLIKCADWVIDMGPKGGSEGGEVIAQGTPKSLISNPHSITGPYLKEIL